MGIHFAATVADFEVGVRAGAHDLALMDKDFNHSRA